MTNMVQQEIMRKTTKNCQTRSLTGVLWNELEWLQVNKVLNDQVIFLILKKFNNLKEKDDFKVSIFFKLSNLKYLSSANI